MQKRIPLVLCFLLLISSQIAGKTVCHKMVMETEEKIHGITFKHILESGATIKEIYLINAASVAKDEYILRLEQAEKEERELCRKIEDDRMHARARFMSDSQLQIYQKLLSRNFMEIKQWLAKLDMPVVSNYYLFSADTIASKGAFESFKNDVFLKAQALLEEYNEQQDIVALQKLIEQYDQMPYRLERFFQKSVQQAIKHCDDTKILKELLSLLGPAD